MLSLTHSKWKTRNKSNKIAPPATYFLLTKKKELKQKRRQSLTTPAKAKRMILFHGTHRTGMMTQKNLSTAPSTVDKMYSLCFGGALNLGGLGSLK